MTAAGEIPQSSALTEATVDSLTEVMSRDPEGLSRQDRDRIIEALRAQRARVASADAAGPKPRAAAGAKAAFGTMASKTADELDL